MFLHKISKFENFRDFQSLVDIFLIYTGKSIAEKINFIPI